MRVIVIIKVAKCWCNWAMLQLLLLLSFLARRPYDGKISLDCFASDSFQFLILFVGEWSLWSLWTICTRTCGSGTQSRQRTQSCTNDVDRAARACNTDPGTWTLWTAWSVCSATCGGGTYTRVSL